MSDPVGDLRNLQDIAVPDAPPLWPPAPGVWVALVIVVAVSVAAILWWRRVRARSAYRRAGLSLLGEVRSAREVNVVLKRVALAAFPRPVVASLYGDEWKAFLGATCRRIDFATIRPAETADEVSPELRDLARTWIRHHRVREV